MFKKLLALLGVVIGLQSIVLGWEDIPMMTGIVLKMENITQLTKLKNKEVFLIRAAKENDIVGVKMWLMAGADINAKNRFKLTALMLASKYGYTEIVKLLKDAGAKE